MSDEEAWVFEREPLLGKAIAPILADKAALNCHRARLGGEG